MWESKGKQYLDAGECTRDGCGGRLLGDWNAISAAEVPSARCARCGSDQAIDATQPLALPDHRVLIELLLRCQFPGLEVHPGPYDQGSDWQCDIRQGDQVVHSLTVEGKFFERCSPNDVPRVLETLSFRDVLTEAGEHRVVLTTDEDGRARLSTA